MRHQSIRHPWGYVVVALAIITLVSLSGCAALSGGPGVSYGNAETAPQAIITTERPETNEQGEVVNVKVTEQLTIEGLWIRIIGEAAQICANGDAAEQHQRDVDLLSANPTAENARGFWDTRQQENLIAALKPEQSPCAWLADVTSPFDVMAKAIEAQSWVAGRQLAVLGRLLEMTGYYLIAGEIVDGIKEIATAGYENAGPRSEHYEFGGNLGGEQRIFVTRNPEALAVEGSTAATRSGTGFGQGSRQQNPEAGFSEFAPTGQTDQGGTVEQGPSIDDSRDGSGNQTGFGNL